MSIEDSVFETFCLLIFNYLLLNRADGGTRTPMPFGARS